MSRIDSYVEELVNELEKKDQHAGARAVLKCYAHMLEKARAGVAPQAPSASRAIKLPPPLPPPVDPADAVDLSRELEREEEQLRGPP